MRDSRPLNDRFHQFRTAAPAIGILFAVSTGILSYVYLTNNFHPVVDGIAYRSAQPNAREIDRYVHEYGIKSIINLRGGNAGQAWFDEEQEAAHKQGIVVFSIPLSARRRLSAVEILTLVKLLAAAPKPLLIHCKHGADRSALASALFLLTVAHKTPAEAASQLSMLYGHIPYFGNSTVAMDQTFWAYADDQSQSAKLSEERP